MINFGKKKDNDKKFSSGDRKMYKAVCSNCGNKCELPFKPSNDKPVYCSDCYKDKRNSNTRSKTMYQAICSNCGDRCEVPFNPTGDKPVFCSNCYGKGGHGSHKGAQHSSGQFDVLNSKLDKILEMLSPASTVEPVSKEKPAQKTKFTETKKAVKKPVKKAAKKTVTKKKATTKKK